jgi:broad specificity phosphatase PhoE
MLPRDLIVIRHGESEGNVANKAGRKGDTSLFTPEFRNRHSREFRLTDRGIKQAQVAGEWLRKNVNFPIDRFLVSDYIRAKETAYELGIEGAAWSVEYQLRERDMALMDNLPPDEKERLYAIEQHQYELDRFFSIPAGGGESVAALCLRLKADMIAHIARDYSGMSVAMVCHGHVMRALQIELLQLGRDDFLRLDGSDDPKEKIHNCQIMWYTRRDPYDGRVQGPKLYAWRSLSPWDPEQTDTGWIRIERKRMTNDQLLEDVLRYPRHVS